MSFLQQQKADKQTELERIEKQAEAALAQASKLELQSKMSGLAVGSTNREE